MLKDVQIDVSKYYKVNELAQLKEFIVDPERFLLNQKLSTINNKVNQLKQRH